MILLAVGAEGLTSCAPVVVDEMQVAPTCTGGGMVTVLRRRQRGMPTCPRLRPSYRLFPFRPARPLAPGRRGCANTLAGHRHSSRPCDWSDAGVQLYPGHKCVPPRWRGSRHQPPVWRFSGDWCCVGTGLSGHTLMQKFSESCWVCAMRANICQSVCVSGTTPASAPRLLRTPWELHSQTTGASDLQAPLHAHSRPQRK